MISSSGLRQLISYIAPAAPGTRRPATGREAYLRPEIGFTPKWYKESLGIDFGRRYHTEPSYRRECALAMRRELKRRFPGADIGDLKPPDGLPDLLSGLHGTVAIAAIYGIPVRYAGDNWPICEHRYLSDEEVDCLEPPDLDLNPFFNDLTTQFGWIAEHQGRIDGYLNWQGVLNNAHRLRGERLFFDLIDNPKRCLRLFDCVCATMIEAAKRLHERQRAGGQQVDFFTVSNCLVNMISPGQYQQMLLPFDRRIADAFGCIGIHNCAWKADPYLKAYAEIPNVGYIDMGLDSDLRLARELFPAARRAIMYTPMDLAEKSFSNIRADVEKIANDFGPCDIVAADIEAGTPDQRVLDFLHLCESLSGE